MQIDTETMTCQFPNLGIQCVKKKEVEKSLETRHKIRVDPFRRKLVLESALPVFSSMCNVYTWARVWSDFIARLGFPQKINFSYICDLLTLNRAIAFHTSAKHVLRNTNIIYASNVFAVDFDIKLEFKVFKNKHWIGGPKSHVIIKFISFIFLKEQYIKNIYLYFKKLLCFQRDLNMGVSHLTLIWMLSSYVSKSSRRVTSQENTLEDWGRLLQILFMTKVRQAQFCWSSKINLFNL